MTTPEKPRASIRKKDVGGQKRETTREEKRMIADLGVSDVRVKVQRTDRASTDRADQVELPECEHCKILFSDDIIYAIHRGWHNHADPLQCNLCGERFDN